MTKEFVQINLSKKQMKFKIRYWAFKQGEHHIVYLPSLQISGYGDTVNEAHNLVKVSITDFAENLIRLKDEARILKVLYDLGWERNKYFKKRMSNLSETTFEDIKREFNIPDKTIYDEGLIEV